MRTLLGFTAVAVCFIGVALQYMLGSKDVRQQALQACSMLEEQSLQQQCIANSLNHNVSIESSQPSEVSEHRAAWSPLVLLAVVLAAAVLLLRQDGNDLHHRFVADGQPKGVHSAQCWGKLHCRKHAWAQGTQCAMLCRLLAGVLRLDMERYGGLTPWSVLTYKVDVWFSSHPFSKLILLLVLTLSLIILGGISLFLVSGHDLYNSVWAAVAGAGEVQPGSRQLRHSRVRGGADHSLHVGRMQGMAWSSFKALHHGGHGVHVAWLPMIAVPHDNYRSAGLDWTFFEHAQHQIAVRLVSLMISIGGMLITALLLGIVSGGEG